MSVGITGYSALGNSVPGDVLVGFTDAPTWVTMLANTAVLLHMVSAVRVCCLNAGSKASPVWPARSQPPTWLLMTPACYWVAGCV